VLADEIGEHAALDARNDVVCACARRVATNPILSTGSNSALDRTGLSKCTTAELARNVTGDLARPVIVFPSAESADIDSMGHGG